MNAKDYKNFDAVTKAVNAVVRDLDITKQAQVDAYAKAIEDAIAQLEKEKQLQKTFRNQLHHRQEM